MRLAAKGLQRLGTRFDLLLSSPVVRAAATAGIIASVYGDKPKPQELSALATGIAPGDALSGVARFTRLNGIMMVGHEPQLSGLVSLLLTGSAESMRSQLKKGGCVALEVADKVEPGSAELLWVLTNRQLRSLRK
jgi:phosphohistidine phosphatase